MTKKDFQNPSNLYDLHETSHYYYFLCNYYYFSFQGRDINFYPKKIVPIFCFVGNNGAVDNDLSLVKQLHDGEFLCKKNMLVIQFRNLKWGSPIYFNCARDAKSVRSALIEIDQWFFFFFFGCTLLYLIHFCTLYYYYFSSTFYFDEKKLSFSIIFMTSNGLQMTLILFQHPKNRFLIFFEIIKYSG